MRVRVVSASLRRVDLTMASVRRAAMKIEEAQRGKRAEGAAGTADEFGVRLSGWYQM